MECTCCKSKLPEIRFIRGNTYSYSPALQYDGQPLQTLGVGQFLMLIVKTPMGETVLSKTLTGSEDGTEIVFDFAPTDTIDLAPFGYAYSIDLYEGSGQDFYVTTEKGVLNLLKDVGNFKDIEVNDYSDAGGEDEEFSGENGGNAPGD